MGATGPMGATGMMGATGATGPGLRVLASAVVISNVIASNRTSSPGVFAHPGTGHYTYTLVTPVVNPNNIDVVLGLRDAAIPPGQVVYVVSSPTLVEFFTYDSTGSLTNKDFSFDSSDLT